MAELSGAEFGAFFEAVHGYRPFHWQSELARRVLDGPGWPQGVDVPTGMGKTALLDIAVFALAVQAQRGSARTAPTRTFMVVDRRLIVDQAHKRAQAIAAALEGASERVVDDVADALRRISGTVTPLTVVRMRGGVTWNARWLAAPNLPAIVVGTVDQFGSRLLFRGYDVSTRSRPIDAALVGTDALLILDEAHMSRPVARTALAVHRYDAAAEQPVLVARRPAPVLVSATLPHDTDDVFAFDAAREPSDQAIARLHAKKHAVLVRLTTRGKDPSAEVARALTDLGLDRAAEPGIDRVAVVCNTVRVARAVFENVCRAASDRVDSVLMIGRCREYERGRVRDEWESELEATPTRRPPRERPLVVVATQTVEVGADFDFDALVSEAAPVDAVLQRIGRLDRFGHLGSTRAVLVYAPARHDEDPVYGAVTRTTWEWLERVAGVPAPVPAKQVVEAGRNGPTVDLGSLAVRRILTAEERSGLSAASPLAPEVIGPTLAAWARTEPAPSPDQPVAPYLHGMRRETPEVFVCWRAGLPQRHEPEARERWLAELGAVPVAAPECVSVPIWEARRFLQGRSPGDLADVEGEAVDDLVDDFRDQSEPVPAVIIAPDGTLHWELDKLPPGATLVVRSESGGHDRWGWTGLSGGDEVVDVADLARRRPALRLRPELLAHLVGGSIADWRTRFTDPAEDTGGGSQAAHVKGILAAVGADAATAGAERPLAGRIGALAEELIDDKRRRIIAVADGWYLVRSGDGLSVRSGDETESSSSSARTPIGLDTHLDDVACRAEEVALSIGLTGDLVGAVRLAGLAHDLGKADPRFQVMLHRGDARRAEAWPELLAKSGIDASDRGAFRSAFKASGLPNGMRHEAGSAALLRKIAAVDPVIAEGIDVELVVHLVATHHGRGRPVLPPAVDAHPVDVAATLPGSAVTATVRSDEVVLDWDGPARFERLGRRYGWWGLALLETVVRLADIECSEGYDREEQA